MPTELGIPITKPIDAATVDQQTEPFHCGEPESGTRLHGIAPCAVIDAA